MKKNNVIGLLGFVGTALGLVANVVSNMAGDKAMKEEVAKQVAEALKNK